VKPITAFLKTKKLETSLAENTTLLRNIAVDVTDKQFGAKGDGISNDTSAFVNALAYLKSVGGGTLKVPNGTFLANFELPSKVTIEGSGIDNTIIKSVSGSNKDVIKGENFDSLSLLSTPATPSQGVRYSIIKNLTIDGNKDNNTAGYGIRTWGCYFSFRDIFVQNCAEDGILTQFTTHQTLTQATAKNQLLESIFENIKIAYCRNGWVYNGPHDSMINNLVIVGCTGWAFKQGTNATYLVANNWNFWANGNALQIGKGMSGNYIVANADGTGTGIECLLGTAGNMISNFRMTGFAIGLILRGDGHSMKGLIEMSATNGVVLESTIRCNLEIVSTSNNNLFNKISETGASRFVVIGNAGTGTLLNTPFRQDSHVEINVGNLSNSIFQFPNNKFMVGGWTPVFPFSNATLLTTDMAPGAANSGVRGGVLKQTAITDLTATPTMADFNNLLAKLRSAGLLT
jgi:hypothetical protein